MATAAGRPETGVEYVANTSHKPLSTKAFFTKHLAVALFGEAATRHFGYQETFSLVGAGRRIADFTGLSQFGFVTGASAQEMSGTAADATASTVRAAATANAKEAASSAANGTAEAASRTWGSYVPGFVISGMDMFNTHVWTPISTVAAPATGYVSDNSDWLVEVGGIALVAAAINKAAQKRGVKNVPFRNFVSVLGGATAVWGTKLALASAGYAEPVAFAKTADMGARILATHFALKHATPLVQWVFVKAAKAMDPLRAPYCFEKPKEGKKL